MHSTIRFTISFTLYLFCYICRGCWRWFLLFAVSGGLNVCPVRLQTLSLCFPHPATWSSLLSIKSHITPLNLCCKNTARHNLTIIFRKRIYGVLGSIFIIMDPQLLPGSVLLLLPLYHFRYAQGWLSGCKQVCSTILSQMYANFGILW